ncbi:MAG: methyltransferase [Legionella sp.]
MKIIKPWFKWIRKDRNNVIEPKSTSSLDFYSLIAGGARLKLVEAMFHLDLFALFENKTYVLESEIIDHLGLMPIRAKKWLHLLTSEQFLLKTTVDNQFAYQLSHEIVTEIDSARWWGIKFFFGSWKVAAEENLTDVLCYGKVKTSVSWPPKTDEEVIWLEEWMTNTAHRVLPLLLEKINFTHVNHFLDVGGGDGTMACALATVHQHLKATVYNLHKSAVMARKKISSLQLNDRVHVLEGDFIKEDTFPSDFDLIFFIRVLFDWNEEINRKLLQMAYHALPQKGLIAICEFYKEENHDLCLANEYRYIFHDDFAPNVMKSIVQYRRMLEDIGFSFLSYQTIEDNFYGVILAQKK